MTRRHLVAAIVASLYVVGYYVFSLARYPALSFDGFLLALGLAFTALTSGILLYGCILLLLQSRAEAHRPCGGPLARRILGGALLLQAVALFAAALGAQRAWGAYWSWYPWECWYLSLWLAIASAAFGAREFSWDGWRASLAVWLTAGFSVVVLWGSGLLLRWVGLASLYGG